MLEVIHDPDFLLSLFEHHIDSFRRCVLRRNIATKTGHQMVLCDYLLLLLLLHDVLLGRRPKPSSLLVLLRNYNLHLTVSAKIVICLTVVLNIITVLLMLKLLLLQLML